MDITDFVNDYLENDIPYQGFCLKFSDEHENLSKDRTYFTGLFTRHTQSFFEPFIETVYDDLIIDDRADFYINKVNRLYLYANINGSLTNLDNLPTATINNTTYPVTQQSTGTYYIDVVASGETFDTFVEYNDIWSDIFVNGVRLPDVKLRFVPLDSKNYFNIGQEINDPQRYGISLSGITGGEKLPQGENRRVLVNLRKPYTVAQKDVVTNVFYKLYIKQGPNNVLVLDWQPINKSFNLNFFNIDTSWLIPQQYFVDIKVIRNGEINIYNQELEFNVVSKFNN